MKNVFYLILLIFINSRAQKNLSENEYQFLHNNARKQINSNIDSSFYYANIIEKSNSNSHKSFAFGIKSYLYQLNNDSIKSNENYLKALNYLKKVQNSENKLKLHSYILNFRGLAEWKKGNLTKALKLYFKGRELSKKANDIEQIIKFNNNISLIYFNSNKLDLAIKISKETDKTLDINNYLINNDKYELNKSNVNFNLGNYYFEKSKINKSYLDSSKYYFNNTIIYSKDLIDNNLNSKLCLANIFTNEKKFLKAENIYKEIIFNTNNSKYLNQYYNCLYNLGYLYYIQNNFKKSIHCFSKVDSLFKKNSNNLEEYLNANYFLSKMYFKQNNIEKTLFHSNIFLDYYKKNQIKKNHQINNINSFIIDERFNNEINILLEINNKKLLLERYSKIIIALIVISYLLFIIYKKKKLQNKIKFLHNEINSEKKLTETSFLNTINIFDGIKLKNKLNIDIEKEKEILEKISKSEKNLEYLKQDFTLYYLAKKVKTNTTYLSYIINKNYKKNFSEYVNELKINYVINELTHNKKYRKYTTQALAESAGFKNSSSFSKSFKKRTGFTPVQFSENL